MMYGYMSSKFTQPESTVDLPQPRLKREVPVELGSAGPRRRRNERCCEAGKLIDPCAQSWDGEEALRLLTSRSQCSAPISANSLILSTRPTSFEGILPGARPF